MAKHDSSPQHRVRRCVHPQPDMSAHRGLCGTLQSMRPLAGLSDGQQRFRVADVGFAAATRTAATYARGAAGAHGPWAVTLPPGPEFRSLRHCRRYVPLPVCGCAPAPMSDAGSYDIEAACARLTWSWLDPGRWSRHSTADAVAESQEMSTPSGLAVFRLLPSAGAARGSMMMAA